MDDRRRVWFDSFLPKENLMILLMYVERQTEFLCTKSFVRAYVYKIGSSKIFPKSRK